MLIGRYTCVLDACVLHPAFLQGTLLWFAAERLYRPVWTTTIMDEWERSLQRRFPDNPKFAAKRTTIEAAFGDAEVVVPDELLECLQLPDKDDRHVLAAALVSKADAIITTNLKHFPEEVCGRLEVEVIHPDTFLVNVIDLDQARALKALQKQRSVMKGYSAEQFLSRFEAAGLVQSHTRLLPLIAQL